MATGTILDLAGVEQRVCDIVSEHLVIPRAQVRGSSSLIEDLGIDSLDVVEIFMSIEEAFGVTLPASPSEPIYQSVFTRRDFRIRDIAELVYLCRGNDATDRPGWRGPKPPIPSPRNVPFTQLSGVWTPDASGHAKLFERLKIDGPVPQDRRRSDGMRCLLLPAATVTIGCEDPGAPADESPSHTVRLDAFRIDAEPVSTTAYCRFLNSVATSWTRSWLI